MTIHSFPRPLLEALAAHETLRKLGFTPEQIFIHRNPPPQLDIAIVLRHQGKQFAITVGRYDDDNWLTKWTELVGLYNSKQLPDDELDELYVTSLTGSHHVQLVLALRQKGITPPGGSN